MMEQALRCRAGSCPARSRWLPASVAGVALVFTSVAWGESTPEVCQQATVGTVTGAVRSADGGPVAGARVRVQACPGDPVRTDGAGKFALPVPAGTHVVTAGAEGFHNG